MPVYSLLQSRDFPSQSHCRYICHLPLSLWCTNLVKGSCETRQRAYETGSGPNRKQTCKYSCTWRTLVRQHAGNTPSHRNNPVAGAERSNQFPYSKSFMSCFPEFQKSEILKTTVEPPDTSFNTAGTRVHFELTSQPLRYLLQSYTDHSTA